MLLTCIIHFGQLGCYFEFATVALNLYQMHFTVHLEVLQNYKSWLQAIYVLSSSLKEICCQALSDSVQFTQGPEEKEKRKGKVLHETSHLLCSLV